MKKILLAALLSFALCSNAFSYTMNYVDCTVSNKVFVWDNDNSYGECVDLTSVYSILSNVTDSTAETNYVALFQSATGVSPTPYTDAGLTYNASTGALSATSISTGAITGSSFDLSASASPEWIFKDSDAYSGSTVPYEVGRIVYAYVDGTSSPNADFYLKSMRAGTEINVATWDESTSTFSLIGALGFTPNTYTFTDDVETFTIGSTTNGKATLILLDGDNDTNSDEIDLQNGSVSGQIAIFVAAADVDTDDTVTIDAEEDSTCTNCPNTGTFTMDKIGENVVLLWTGATWVVLSSQLAL